MIPGLEFITLQTGFFLLQEFRACGRDQRALRSPFGNLRSPLQSISPLLPYSVHPSAHIPDIEKGNYDALIDLKPALDESELDARIRSDFLKYNNKDFINSLGDLLPLKAIEPIVDLCGVDHRKKVNSITKEERRRLLEAIKYMRIPLLRFRPIDEAIITKGGVAVSEINPKTMESKLVSDLYFAGEVLDLDAYTGGFNLQIAFSTAVVAGENAAER